MAIILKFCLPLSHHFRGSGKQRREANQEINVGKQIIIKMPIARSAVNLIKINFQSYTIMIGMFVRLKLHSGNKLVQGTASKEKINSCRNE